MHLATAMLSILADAAPLEPLKSLVEQWPWLAVVAALGKGLLSVLDRVTTRHVTFIDALDRRDQESLVHQATMSLAMTGIDAKLALNASKSDFKEFAGRSRCEAQVLLAKTTPVPHGA